VNKQGFSGAMFPVPGLRGVAAIATSSVAGFMLGWLWYGPLFGSQFVAAISVDKKMDPKDFQAEAKKRWPATMGMCFASSMACTVIRSYATWAALTTFGIQTLSGAVCTAALAFAGSHLPSVHHHFWEGRPYDLIFIAFSNELTAAVLAGVIVFTLM